MTWEKNIINVMFTLQEDEMKNRIRQLREEKRLTQEQLGEMVGTSRQAINAIETENPSRPSGLPMIFPRYSAVP